MDLSKFEKQNLVNLTVDDLKEFRALTLEQIKELAKQDKNFATYLIYKNLSNKQNQLETYGNYQRVYELLIKGDQVELVSPSHLYSKSAKFNVKPVPVETVVVEKAMSLEDFAAMKANESEPKIDVPETTKHATQNEAETPVVNGYEAEKVVPKVETDVAQEKPKESTKKDRSKKLNNSKK